MTYTSDPPRLRTRAPALPAELALALENLPDEEASLAELEQLTLSVRSRAALAPASPSAEMARPKTPRRWQRATVFHGALGAALLFALGAGAGVLVVSGLFFGFRSSRDSAAPRGSSAGDQVPTKTRATPRRAPEPSLAGSTASVPNPPVLRSPPANLGSSRPDSAPTPTPELGSAVELGLVGRAQAALETDAVRALALASDHERKFPTGALVQEREVIAIDALVRLGRLPDAEARAARFRERFPASVHARRVDVLLGVPAAAPSDRK
jgi:hypothetical protein